MKINYRPEIDGLRAIAVGVVILYHAQITIFGNETFKGGFIGVDIFFVISGYLITSIIFKELITTGSFSFKHFYERRIRRILPVLIFVMLASLPFAWMYLLPINFIDFSKSILYSLGFSSNFYFWHSGEQYGAESGLLKPFLHTWSLSVEEQYYIFFPVLLIFIFKYFKQTLPIILFISLITSLLIADWGSKNYTSATFYFVHSRMWELLAGSLLAYYEITSGQRSKYQKLNRIFPSIGLFLILHSVFFFNDKMFHPSFFTLSPIVGVCLIIWFSSKDEIVTKILSTKLFVGIGLISYSLYLWHYPVFAFARIIEITEGSLLKKILLGITILILSIISYFLIERPSRNKNNKFKIIISFIIISSFFLAIYNASIISKNGYKNRFYYSKTYELGRLSYLKENINFEINYNYDDYDYRKNALIVGNSHADDILEILSKTILEDKIYFNLISPKKGTDRFKRAARWEFQLNHFYKFLEEKKSIISEFDNEFLNHFKKQYENSDLIILSSRYFEEDLKVLDRLIKILKEDDKKIIIFDNALEQTIRVGFNRLDYYIYKNNKFPEKDILKKIEKNMFLDLKNKDEVNQRVKLIAKKNEVLLIERKKIFCNLDKKSCPSITNDGYKIYWDYSHITAKGAEFFARIIEKDKKFLKYLSSTLKIPLN